MDSEEYLKMRRVEKTNWWFVGKRELVDSFLKKTKGNFFLDVGAGTGENTKKFSQTKKIFPMDINRTSLEFLSEKNRNVSGGDMNKLPYKNNSFNGAILLDIVEHIENDLAAMSEISRVVKKGGSIIITVPAHQFLWSYHDEALHHKRRYGKKELLSLVENSGFEIQYWSYWNSILFLPILLFRHVKKLFGEKRSSDVKNMPKLVNNIFLGILKIENFAIKKGFKLPFGVSLFVVARKI